MHMVRNELNCAINFWRLEFVFANKKRLLGENFLNVEKLAFDKLKSHSS